MNANTASPSLLQALIAPHTIEHFYAAFWPDRHFAVHGPLERLPEIFRARELHDFHELARKYTGYCAITSRDKDGIMIEAKENPDILFRMGLTIFLSDIAASVPGCRRFLRQLESELGIREGISRIGLFASPESSGLQTHYDVYDIFSIQLIGTKRFRVARNDKIPFPCTKQYARGKQAYDDLFPQAINGYADPDAVPYETVDMKPGSVLFLPRGYWHTTEASDEVSVSVSIGFETPTALDCILPLVKSYLMQDPKWRRPLYGAWGGPLEASAIERSDELLKDLSEATKRLSARDVIFNARDERGRFALLNDQSRFQHVPTTVIEAQPQKGPDGAETFAILMSNADARFGRQLILRVDGLSPEAVSMFKWLEKQDVPFTVGDFRTRFGADDAALNRIFEIAVRSNLLRMLWFPKLATGS
jgi:ribosomal protein L16 Arg81 hydroxylase